MRVLSGWTTANRAALAVLAGSALLCASAAAGMRRVAPLPPVEGARAAAPLPAAAPRPPAADDARLLAAVERDPFRPDRRRAPGRYRLPGDPEPPANTAFVFRNAPPPPPFTLLGTVVLPGGRGMAALAGSQGGSGRLVRVGEEMEGFRVVRVSPGAATLSDGDTTLVLRTPGGAP